MIDGPPKVVPLAVDLHEHLVQMPPPVVGAIPSTRCFRISAATLGPKRFHRNPTVSWLTSMPLSCNRSSTLRNDSGNRTYGITARRMILGLVLKYLKGERFVILLC